MIQAEADVEHELVICDSSRCRMCAWQNDMMEVWPNPLVNLGSQKEGNFCTVPVPCFKA